MTNKKKNDETAVAEMTVKSADELPKSPGNNRHARRAANSRRRRYNKNRIVTEDKVVYKDDSYKDKTKRVFSHGLNYAKERIASAKKKFDRPERIETVRRDLLTDCLVINRDGRERAFMPDVPPCHKILVHGCIAKVLVSKVCMLVRITRNYEKDTDKWIDGSWAITPAEYRMMQATTIQHLRRRRWFFLRRYWYEINFDGRVQPAHLFYDYELDPTASKVRLWVTREYVPVAKTDKLNDYFRFWKHKPGKAAEENVQDQKTVETAVPEYNPSLEKLPDGIIKPVN